MITEDSQITIELQSVPVVSYAMAHNRVPVVSELRIHRAGPDLLGAELRLEIRDSEGALTQPCNLRVDLAGGHQTAVQGVDLRLDPAAMFQVDEQRPGQLTAQVLLDGELLHKQSTSVQVLAAKQWLSRPLELSLEMLAAFVMPNDPAVGDLVHEAAALLQQRTGNPSLNGYQDTAERVDEIARSLFDAMRARNVVYSEPPASWGDEGQKVRTPHDVLVGRLGTCLDTTVVLAAAMEQCGIHPLLWLIQGHAFLGYWRAESSLANIVHTEVADVVNLIDLGHIRLVETTLVTASDRQIDFRDTHGPAYARAFAGGLDNVLGVVDVFTARRNEVFPLPARTRQPTGDIEVVEYRPAAHSAAPEWDRPRTADSSPKSRDAVPSRVSQWKNALLDLSLRNRLINFKENGALALTVPGERLGAVEDLLHEGKKIALRPADAIDAIHLNRGIRTARDLPDDLLTDLLTRDTTVFCDLTDATYTSRLRNLAYKARTVVEETGANNLYIAFGSLLWQWEGRELRSPLVLVPVNLVTRGRQGIYRIELDESGSSTPNYCLLEKLKQLDIKIPGLANPEDDGAGIDLDAALRSVREAVAESGQPWRVEATAHVAILQFAKFRLWKDLDESWETFVENPLVRHLVHTPTDPFTDFATDTQSDVDLDELAGLCPVPADASQLDAVSDAVAGRSFVLEGPPGTGKSQTITNLLSRAVSEGRKVLFVAEKRAALDVVQKRLDSVGMGPFSLDLHDKGSKPAAVRAQIKAALEHRIAVDEQGLRAQQEDLRASRRTLDRYAGRLHEENRAGLSLYKARDMLLALGEDGPSLDVPQALVTSQSADELADLRRLVQLLPDFADPARPSAHHPWGFVGAVDPATLDVEAYRASVADMDAAVATAPTSGPLAEVLRAARTPADLAVAASLLTAPPIDIGVLDETRTSRWSQATGALTQEVATFVAAAHPGLDVATPAALDLPLADLHAQATAAASSSWFGRKKRLQAVLAQLAPALRPDAHVKPKAVPELTAALLTLQGAVHGLARRANGIPGMAVPPGWNPLTDEGRRVLDHQLGWLRWAGQAVDNARREDVPPFTLALRQWLGSRSETDAATAAAVERLADAARSVQQIGGLSGTELSAWAGDTGLVARWIATQDRRAVQEPQLLGLRRWAGFVHHLEPLRAGMDTARRALLTGTVAAEDAVKALDRGLAITSIAERMADTGLEAFDATSHERTIKRFTSSASAVRDLMTTELPRQVLEARPFQPETARGQVGALQRELAKQRRGLGVRALLSQYGDLITQVMPCVLVSPDSLARFFPAQAGLFDLVVFDEASQIRVADAVGAMGRAKAVVVVGDSKQMPPTSFAEVSLTEDEDHPSNDDGVLAVEDEESILSECVHARVPRKWLSWHYRSQDESLIAFSNRHYYEDRLSSFPAPTAGLDGYGVTLVRVEGVFHRSGKGRLLRTNPIEAEAVVAEIRRRFDAAATGTTPSIGVVTFNQQQRAYIEGLLRDSRDDRLTEALDAPDGLFVKNLENVQGDERDVILFSTAFSVNDRGVLPLNFGPLNRAGGERRLNVAVTRARRQVIVFSSFDPAQLRAEETSSVGIKHLRAYLDMAAEGPGEVGPRGARVAAVDRHRDDIAAQLRETGLVVSTDVGLSDFRVDLAISLPERPEYPVVAVLLDGPGWASRRTVSDRDGLPVEVLSKMLGWPAVERVWLPEWITAPEAVLERLSSSARTPKTVMRTSEPQAPRVPPASQPSTLDEKLAPSVATLRSGPVIDVSPPGQLLPNEAAFTPWVPLTVQSRSVLDDLPSRRAVKQVRSVIEDVVATEGPIHENRLAKLVASAFNLHRVSAGRAAAILKIVPDSLRPRTEEPFLWPADVSPTTWRGFRRASEEAPRAVEEVSLVEIRNAMAALCYASAGMERDELLREALAVFGGRRLTAAIRSRLEEAVDGAVRDGLLQEAAGMVTALQVARTAFPTHTTGAHGE